MRKKKHPITLIEVMIVIVLIGIIGGALAYNMRGSLDKGKEFKTKQGIAQIENVLLFAMAEGETVNKGSWEGLVRKSPLVKDANKLLKDGWNDDYIVEFKDETFTVKSDHVK